MSTDTGDNAFPTEFQVNSSGDVISYAAPGMTLLDHFAGLAMQGELASQTPEREWTSPVKLVMYAYQVAEAMIAEKRRRETL